MADASNDFAALTRQYLDLWGQALRGSASQPAAVGVPGLNDMLEAWGRQAGGQGGLGPAMEHFNRQSSDWYAQMQQACASGVAQGWLCPRENGGIRWGRVFEAGAALNGFSVDVVQIKDIAGPHHSHPLGEIDLILPITPGALFDGHAAGWCVYGPDSAHNPTVTQGEAWVLYLLPEGQIQFTRRAA